MQEFSCPCSFLYLALVIGALKQCKLIASVYVIMYWYFMQLNDAFDLLATLMKRLALAQRF